MTRKESEKEADRPHYYSQFWLDVAAGRRIIGAPKPNDEVDTYDPELDAIPPRRSSRNTSSAISDGYEETIAHPEVEPEFDADEYAEPELDEEDLEENDITDGEIPTIIEDTEIPDMDLAPTDDVLAVEAPVEEIAVAEVPVEEIAVEEVPAEEVDEDFFGEEEEEEEDDLNWNAGRGRKKPKPRGGVAKLPVKKPPKREPRRGF